MAEFKPPADATSPTTSREEDIISLPSGSHAGSISRDKGKDVQRYPYTRHSKFYFEDVVILVSCDRIKAVIPAKCLQVENELFRVPKVVFEHSEAFADMFAVPLPPDMTVEGTDDNYPLHLEGYLAEDFTQLLRVLIVL
jgi:hypothetical protein